MKTFVPLVAIFAIIAIGQEASKSIIDIYLTKTFCNSQQQADWEENLI